MGPPFGPQLDHRAWLSAVGGPYPEAVLRRLSQPLSPEAYRRIAVLALALLVLMVVTGAGVRLTGSGLGCTDWPNCTDTQFVAPLELHPMVEFVNRLITGLVSIAVALAVLGSLRRSPRRRDLVWLSWGLVAGVVAQILLGAVVVLSDLNPWLVQGHFVVSMLLLLDAVVLSHRAALPDTTTVRAAVTPALLGWGRALVGAGVLVILTGTLVTGSGPHSGHSADVGEIRRLPIAVHNAAQIHGIVMIAFLAIAIWVLVQLRRHHGEALVRPATTLLTVLVLQAAIGYTQYFTGVPPLLVGLHVLGASLLWVAVLHLFLQMRWPIAAPLELQASGAAQSKGEHSGHRANRDLIAGR